MYDSAPALDISVVGGLASLIFNLPSGLAGYAIQLCLTATKSGVILHEGCDITTEFDGGIEAESTITQDRFTSLASARI